MKIKKVPPTVIPTEYVPMIRTTFLHELTAICGKYAYDITALSKTDNGYNIDFEAGEDRGIVVHEQAFNNMVQELKKTPEGIKILEKYDMDRCK